MIYKQLRPEGLPFLLLQEAIALAGEHQRYTEEGRKPDGTFLDLPAALAKLLIATSGTMAIGSDLQADVVCAKIDLQTLDARQAEAAMESARGTATNFSDSTEVNLMVAEFKVACMKARVDSDRKADVLTKMMRVSDEGLPLLLNDPVRRFEVICDLIRGAYGFDGDRVSFDGDRVSFDGDRVSFDGDRVSFDGDSVKNIHWALSALDLGPWGNEIHLLNGLFHKASFVVDIGSLVPDLPSEVASDLEDALERVDRHGDSFCLGRYYELLGCLRRDPFALKQALLIYEALGLRRSFLKTWKVLDKVDERSRGEVSNWALKSFGKDDTRRMVTAVSGTARPAVEAPA